MKKKSGLKTNEISDRTGIKKTTLDKLFAGVTADPQLGTIQPVVHCMGYTLDDLIEGIDKNATNIQQLSKDSIEVAQSYQKSSKELKNAIRRMLQLKDIEDNVDLAREFYNKKAV